MKRSFWAIIVAVMAILCVAASPQKKWDDSGWKHKPEEAEKSVADYQKTHHRPPIYWYAVPRPPVYYAVPQPPVYYPVRPVYYPRRWTPIRDLLCWPTPYRLGWTPY